MLEQRTLVLDIETSPMSVYTFGLKDQNIGLNQIQRDWYVLAWSAKWLNSPASDIMYYDTRNRKWGEDKQILMKLWKLLDEADIVITQYGSGFDCPRLNTRFIMHGMKPPSPYKHLDTYRIVKNVARFTSNKLEYLTDKLCTRYKKLSHKKYPGMTLWTECLDGNRSAWEEMKKYNIHDVLSTEELYNKIKAWTPERMPKPFKEGGQSCGVCGKRSLEKRGFSTQKSARYQRYQCQSCGSWTREKIK